VSVDETLAAINAAVGCQQCGRPLDGSVSDDFDTEGCQTAWHAARASRLPAGEPVRVFVGPGSTAWGLTVVAPLLDEFMARTAEQVRALRARQRQESGEDRSPTAT